MRVEGLNESENATGIFPLVLVNHSPTATLDEACDWLLQNLVTIKQRLSSSGAILFRGFPVADDKAFDAFVTAFGYETFTYEESLSNAVRKNRTPRVFTANEAPSSEGIFLHNEMAQTPIFPTRLFFYCEQDASSGGQTSLCRCDQLYDELMKTDPDFVRACEDKGVKYTNVMPSSDDATSGQGRGWQATLGAAGREEAEARLAELGYSWTWLEDGSLGVTTGVLPAVRRYEDGRSIFFNQLIAAYQGWGDVSHLGAKIVCFGDGSDIREDQMKNAIERADELVFDLAWQQGDVALVDNFLVMHGRRPFAGKRTILASFATSSGEVSPPAIENQA